ncbi:flavin monoamine oxidase family protein [Desulfosudis oleivorans]|uniref:Amine oxidase n=1 Tax=Desulfosudis oleivorans (strain DSM 6200 / JCM 39069 / Hxd3) TaxID=96561 RepID=A8ZS58_DESOH|nr:FAD-dependent oxidoreductase [Desulfosudis oleivorans]ABW66076.1 amine oxidase [Desulfosudis oleivorans Hxd3]
MSAEQESVDTIIIGGGLSGLYTAFMLTKKKKSFVLLEARPRVGGRILSPAHNGFFTDLGPSWYWPARNPRVNALVKALDLAGYPQFESGLCRFQARDGQTETIPGYPMNPPGWRLDNGMISLVNGLCSRIPGDRIRLNHPVCKIKRLDNGARVTVGCLDQVPQCRLEASSVILALPPRLAAGSILFTPDLPHDLTQAMLRASTWMAGQAKFFALYDKADWRRSGLSGQGFSLCGPLGEIHDGSGKTDSPYGLTGFVGIPALRRKDSQTMIQAILGQLALLYGHTAAQPVSVYYQDWAQEPFTATEYDQRTAHNHPEFLPPSGKTSTWNNTLHFAGSETADDFGGYLEGALSSAERAVLSLG